MPKKKPKRPPKTPKYRLHKASGQGYVELDGRNIYLGKYELPETRTAYHAKIAEWEANGRTLPVPPEEITVVELLARFWEHAKGYYRRPDGANTGELGNYRTVVKILRELYGPTKAMDFGPRALKTVRQRLIDRGNTRKTINKQTGRIRNIFRWAVAEESVEPSVHQKLVAVTNLKFGRTEARETPEVPPVPEPHIEAVRPHLSRQVWAMIQLQELTGARPGDLVIMRPVDIDTGGTVWEYRPQTHKTSYRGHKRIVFLGPKAQEVVRQFLDRPITAFMFSPREAEAERRAALHAERKTPLPCGNRPGTNKKRKPKRKPGERYTTDTYRRAIQRACEKAGISKWHPHQLRHNAGARVRREAGIEAAQVVLGLKSIRVTEVYAKVARDKAARVLERIG